jgi:hypothetical protein
LYQILAGLWLNFFYWTMSKKFGVCHALQCHLTLT